MRILTMYFKTIKRGKQAERADKKVMETDQKKTTRTWREVLKNTIGYIHTDTC